MSEISKDICDFCGRETDDRYNIKGWIQLEGLTSVTVSKGRKRSGQAKTDFLKMIVEESLDFCCFEHFMLFFKGMGKKMKDKDKEGKK